MNSLIETVPLPLAVTDLLQQAKEYVSNSRAHNTVRSYNNAWHHFNEWCLIHGVEALPASALTVVAYFQDVAHHYAISTLSQRKIVIKRVHRLSKLPDPTESEEVREMWLALCRTKGTAQHGKNAITTNDLQAMIDVCGNDLRGIRDKALLLFAFCGAFRRSELVALDLEDITFNAQGILVNIRRSKTDQTSKGQLVGIRKGKYTETCPVAAMQQWLHIGNIQSGALFFSVGNNRRRLCDKSVSLIIKDKAKRIGLDPTLYSGHSMRAGLITAVGEHNPVAAQRQARHRNFETTVRYIRPLDAMRDNLTQMAGL